MNEKKILNLTTLSSIDLLFKTIFEMLVLVVVTNLFGTEVVGKIGIATGVFVFIAYLAFSPETYLLKEINKIQKNLAMYYQVFSLFWIFRFIVLLLLIIIISTYFFMEKGNELALIFLVISLIQLIKIYQQSIYEFYYVTYQQKIVVIQGIAFKIFFTLLLGVIYLKPSLNIFLLIYFLSYFVPLIYWLYDSKKRFAKKDISITLVDVKGMFLELKDFSIWDHLIKSSLNAMYRIDTFILFLFLSPLQIGYYTLALSISNYFQIIPQFFQKALVLFFDKEVSNGALLKKSLKANLIVNVIQVLAFLILGKIAIEMIFNTNTDEVYRISLILIVAVSIFNIVRPYQSLLINLTTMKNLFIKIYLPILGWSVVSLLTFVYMWGIDGALISKLLTFVFLSLLLIKMSNNIKVGIK
ncbi:hypothetical protein [Planococcus halotolerans]|uniref:Polysaccharide biosynthesis protein n=1 Tax=Planococcus halotolerans TaxID=2233542 RepID=A0A365L5K4_9BACL|nr:hypothetical protein [Planococcus halotolerans]RAZ80718.1 hypothetical protein DP120_00040 [Planococcus halotolerans]